MGDSNPSIRAEGRVFRGASVETVHLFLSPYAVVVQSMVDEDFREQLRRQTGGRRQRVVATPEVDNGVFMMNNAIMNIQARLLQRR